MFGKGKWGRRAVGDTLAEWPRMENGSLEPPVFLCHSEGDNMADTIRVNMLRSFGIPCVQRNSNDGDFGEIIMGVSVTGADLFVPQSLYEDAKSLLREDSDDDENL